MSTLRKALILVLAGAAMPVFADQITCESHEGRTEACGTVVPGSSVRVIQQISSSPCIEGRTWGADNDSIWVAGGCRAVFDVQPPSYSYNEEQPRYEQHRYARAESAREMARGACVSQAVAGQPFGPGAVRTNDVHWISDRTLSVSLDTPKGPMTCTVDRAGNIRSIEGQ
jgi:hypothetical protein